jgi:hypothetical protein
MVTSPTPQPISSTRIARRSLDGPEHNSLGAGYTISPAAGDVATYVKLLRVGLLVPVVFAIPLLFRGSSSEPRLEGPHSRSSCLVLLRWLLFAAQPFCPMLSSTSERCFAMVPRCRDRRSWYEDIVQESLSGRLATSCADGHGDDVDRRARFRVNQVRLLLKSERWPETGPRQVEVCIGSQSGLLRK